MGSVGHSDDKGSVMHKSLCASLLGLASLILASCSGSGGPQGRLAHTEKPELLAMLQLGRPVLDCREACLHDWKRVQPTAMSLDAKKQWDDLAVLVMRTGYQDDLSLYYLGRAAEGTGFNAAAASYYRQSIELSGTSISCSRLSRLCGGATLPNAASVRLAAVEQPPASNRPPPKRRAIIAPPPSAGPAPTTEPAAVVEQLAPPAEPLPPPAPVAPAPPPAPPAATPNSGMVGASDYIEPPPASR